ncbi:M56 family metallopeptidase [Nonomuraea sp. NPDC005650]|uniref:M56 family metallopeptidase n=1 Tax=Nonomuraea sp. NPDC005650 TaxID=3157045 RepID=UPI0033BAE781
MIAWLVPPGIALLPVALGDRAARALAGAPWTHRCPRAALVLWQAAGLAAGLGAICVGLVAGVAPLAALFPHGVHTLARHLVTGHGLDGLGPPQLLALLLSTALPIWLLAHTIHATAGIARERRRQRLLIDIVADHHPGHDVYVLPSSKKAAYCVPGRHHRVVVSQGTLDLLTTSELQAVLRHEHAHARGHHDLALLPFLALTHAFPRLSAAHTARHAVAVLLEMIADDHARQAHGDLPLARALVRMAGHDDGPRPAPFTLTDTGTAERLQRLLTRRAHTPWVPATAYATAMLLLGGPVTVLLAPLIFVTT